MAGRAAGAATARHGGAEEGLRSRIRPLGGRPPRIRASARLAPRGLPQRDRRLLPPRAVQREREGDRAGDAGRRIEAIRRQTFGGARRADRQTLSRLRSRDRPPRGRRDAARAGTVPPPAAAGGLHGRNDALQRRRRVCRPPVRRLGDRAVRCRRTAAARHGGTACRAATRTGAASGRHLRPRTHPPQPEQSARRRTLVPPLHEGAARIRPRTPLLPPTPTSRCAWPTGRWRATGMPTPSTTVR